ncbi:dihydroorotase [Lentisalinibacter orientalis]|uniref:dihydroorotase n=1 Tax=Lentisalinibacter orientalis TaxID=2992241 RepID=UPI00386A3195
MKKLLITNARLVNEGETRDADVLIDGERIEKIDASIEAGAGTEVLDAGGRYLIPGMIDDQVHFREPGLTHKGDIATESAAAVAGGITSYMEMPNVDPPTTTIAALEEKYDRAAGRSRANYAFYLGATNDNISQIRALAPGTACGIKVFMGASTGNLLVDDPDALELIFRDAPVTVVTHCEDSPMIWEAEAAAREKYGDDVPMSEHPHIRSAEACYKSSSYAVDMARRHGTRLHVLHLTTAMEMELFSTAPRGEKHVTAEVCVHHLWFDESDYERLGALIKCNPAIKSREDRDALRQALADGRIDVVATDHAPHTAEEKANSYFGAPAGLPLVQHALPSMLEHVHEGRYSLEFVVDRTSHAIADIFGVQHRGYVREGYYADLAIVDMDDPWTVSTDNLLYKCGWSPFEGVTFRSRIRTTLVNGRVVWDDGRIVGDPAGQRMSFDPPTR